MSGRQWTLVLALTIPLMGVCSRDAWAQRTPKPATPPAASSTKPAREFVTFGTLKAPALDAARVQALDWLKAAGKNDEASQQEFNKIWSAESDRPLLDRVASTLSFGDADAAKLLNEARDADAAAPQELPAVLKDANRPAFFRANLSLAYAKALANRRVHEEALDVLRLIKPEDVVDPASYFFHRAVAEHALKLKEEASRSIISVIEDVADAPNRYKDVSVLMLYDMQNWREKDLGDIARKMEVIERRLELSRGGPKTQKIQKEVVARLDELIKQIENQAKGTASSGCPSGGQQSGNGGSNNPNSPMKDSNIATNGGPGNVDQKKLKNLAENWGKLPEKERAQEMANLTRDMPPRYREVIEKYFKDLARSKPGQP